MAAKDKLTKKIKKLINDAPSDWASIVSGKMDVTKDAVYKYIRNARGGNDEKLEIHKHLKKLIADESDKINRKLLES